MAKQRVLIIDDDKDIADLFRIVLSLVGFDCDIVYTAREGLSKLSLYIPDIVLLDLRLGLELGGEDILYQIRTNPRLQDTRVVAITGYPNLAEPIADLADLILLKPVDVDQLKTLIQRLSSTEKKSRQEYFRDPVSGLFHQEFFQTRLELAFERKKRIPALLYAVVAFSLDFEPAFEEGEALDSLNRILKQVGTRLTKNFRPTDTIARISTNEFAYLPEDLKKPEDVQAIVNRLSQELLRTYQVKEKMYRPVLRIGAALCEERFHQPDEILQTAESNMHSIPYLEESHKP
jgi:diguanylate cyclase (GGDEF)-like protein